MGGCVKMSARFGLVHVDFKTQKRTPKLSARWFAEHVTKLKALPVDGRPLPPCDAAHEPYEPAPSARAIAQHIELYGVKTVADVKATAGWGVDTFIFQPAADFDALVVVAGECGARFVAANWWNTGTPASGPTGYNATITHAINAGSEYRNLESINMMDEPIVNNAGTPWASSLFPASLYTNITAGHNKHT